MLFCLFVCLELMLRPSQQLWSCRDVVSILWDFYPKLGRHEFKKKCSKYNHPTKPINKAYEGGSESSVIGVITLLIDMIGCCIIP